MAENDQSAVVQELYRRRDSLDPDKRAVVDELAKRMNIAQPEKTGFFGRIGENLTGLKDLAVGAVTHPIDTAKAMLTPDPAVSKEAADAFNRGDYGRYAGSQIEAIPLIGPQIRRTEQDLRKGDYGAIGGDVATAAALSQLPRVASAIPRAGAAVSDVLMSPGVIKGLKRSTEGVVVGSAMHGNLPGVGLGVAGRIGAGMLENAAERRAAAKLPPAAASIVEKAQTAPPLTAAEQALADHIMANVEPEAAAPPAAGPTTPPAITRPYYEPPPGPADMPAQPVGSAMPATPAPALQMPGPQGAPIPASPAEAVSQSPQVQVIPSPEPAVPAEVYKAKAQAAKSTKMADVLHQLEITPEQVSTISDADWTRIEKATKINRPNSPESLQMVVDKLKSLEKPSAAAEVPEALRKNPAAMKAAMDVRDALAKK